jgi:hypothetical protein
MSSTFPVKTAAAFPAAEQGVGWPMHEQAERVSGADSNTTARRSSMPTFSQNRTD